MGPVPEIKIDWLIDPYQYQYFLYQYFDRSVFDINHAVFEHKEIRQ